ncbi:hypothetical protein P775_04990 [Puniceibacterium antarcticum]|uniref:(S)-ureidoglycine aminohydrolase cupin domain-containing protein n=1 Tax=Puniceibacterium antarcticum TaxID=1206336 RepID=A0A2G8RJT1_9RHOB|nr:cupin domain-containing protein [Puniceibacterium antarcticum]PIL21348.1 hypothetical protein P775_04990 [Puniceibacterium antarcticum]
MQRFQIVNSVAGLDLGATNPKPTSVSGNQREAAKALFQSNDKALNIGIWDCSPGRFTADRAESSETCYILSGRVTLHDSDGRAQDLGAGDMMTLPKGWRGEWTIHEQTRKIYILHEDTDQSPMIMPLAARTDGSA